MQAGKLTGSVTGSDRARAHRPCDRELNWDPSKWMMDIRPALHFTNPKIVDIAMTHHCGLRRVAVQAGGHIGIWPAKLAAYFEDVVSFEPTPENWQACMLNIKAGNVLVVPACVSSKVGFVRISDITCKRFSGSQRVISDERGDQETITVPCMTIASMPKKVCSRIDAIFLDIEGHELEALKGAEEIIKQNHPTIVVEENKKSLMGRRAGELNDYLVRLGYKFIDGYRDDLIFCARQDLALSR